jgi:hypothetical protein
MFHSSLLVGTRVSLSIASSQIACGGSSGNQCRCRGTYSQVKAIEVNYNKSIKIDSTANRESVTVE